MGLVLTGRDGTKLPKKTGRKTETDQNKKDRPKEGFTPSGTEG